MRNRKNTAGIKDVMRSGMPAVALVIMVIAFAVLTKGKILRANNLKTIALQSYTYIVAGLGILFTLSLGNMDMSLDGIVRVSGIVGLIVGETVSPWLTFPTMILLTVICELLIGTINITLGIDSIVASFVIGFLCKGISGMVVNNRTSGLSLPRVFGVLNQPGFFLAVALVSLVVISILFHYTKVGKYNMYIGSNFAAAKASGIAVNRYKFAAYLVAGVMMGIASILSVVRSGAASASSGSSFHIYVLLTMVLGGGSLTGGTKEKVYNVVVGVLLYFFLKNGLAILGVTPNVVGLIEGIIFLLAVTFTFDRDGIAYIL